MIPRLLFNSQNSQSYDHLLGPAPQRWGRQRQTHTTSKPSLGTIQSIFGSDQHPSNERRTVSFRMFRHLAKCPRGMGRDLRPKFLALWDHPGTLPGCYDDRGPRHMSVKSPRRRENSGRDSGDSGIRTETGGLDLRVLWPSFVMRLRRDHHSKTPCTTICTTRIR